MPVACGSAWGIEAGRLVQAQDVLAGNDTEAGLAGHGQLYEIPWHLRATFVKVITYPVFLFFRQASPPAKGRIIVVSPCINDTVGGVVLRQIRIVRAGIEGKLQDLHSRQAKIVAQFLHLRGDDPEVFGDDRHLWVQCLQIFKKFAARDLLPVTVLSSCLIGRDRPACLESPEMVNTDHVALAQLVREPPGPPVEVFGQVIVPTVEGVPPALTGPAEIVRRDPGDRNRLPIGVQLEKALVGPDVSGIVGDENRDVAKIPICLLLA